MKIYDQHSVKEYLGLDTVQIYRLKEMVQNESDQLIENVHCKILLIGNKSGAVPLIIPYPVQKNCYVCSFRAHYLDYAKDELRELANPMLNFAAKPLFLLISSLLKWIDSEDVIFIDNWLLSTNLHPEWLTNNLAELVALVRESYPQKTIVIRSLNPIHNAGLLKQTNKLGFLSLLSRRIYIFDAKYHQKKLRSDLKKDLQKLASSKSSFEQWHVGSDEEAKRIIELYQQLYLSKYSTLNPQFTVRWLTQGVNCDYLKVRVLRRECQIVAVLGFVQQDDLVTAPLIGYDLQLKEKLNLYRLITAELSKLVLEQNLRSNRSAGADEFKLNRGAVATFETSAILPKPSKMKQWNLFIRLVNYVSRKVMGAV